MLPSSAWASSGGSMAKSIKNRTSHTVWGIDLNAETMTMARMCGAIDAPLTEENLPQADLILVAIRPAPPSSGSGSTRRRSPSPPFWWTCAA